MDKVPWPPDEHKLLQVMALDELGATGAVAGEGAGAGAGADRTRDGQAAYAAYKRAFRKASLRWHPDKFQANFGAKVSQPVEVRRRGVCVRECVYERRR